MSSQVALVIPPAPRALMMRPTKVWRVRAKPDAKARKLSDTSRDYNLQALIERPILAVFCG
jgi:hypothetical protein